MQVSVQGNPSVILNMQSPKCGSQVKQSSEVILTVCSPFSPRLKQRIGNLGSSRRLHLQNLSQTPGEVSHQIPLCFRDDQNYANSAFGMYMNDVPVSKMAFQNLPLGWLFLLSTPNELTLTAHFYSELGSSHLMPLSFTSGFFIESSTTELSHPPNLM